MKLSTCLSKGNSLPTFRCKRAGLHFYIKWAQMIQSKDSLWCTRHSIGNCRNSSLRSPIKPLNTTQCKHPIYLRLSLPLEIESREDWTLPLIHNPYTGRCAGKGQVHLGNRVLWYKCASKALPWKSEAVVEMERIWDQLSWLIIIHGFLTCPSFSKMFKTSLAVRVA